MALQSNANTGWAYIAESVWGTTPAGALKEMRVLSDSIKLERSQNKSEEYKSHRQATNVILGSHGVSGSFKAEYGDYLDDWLESALCGAFSSNVLKLGQTLKHFTAERRLQGIGWSQQFTGVRANGLSLKMQPDPPFISLEIPVIGRTLVTAADGLNGPSGWLVNNVAGYSVGATAMAIDTGTTNPAAGDTFTIYNPGSTAVQTSEQIYVVSSFGAGTVNFVSTPLDVAVADNAILHFFRPATVVTANDPYNSFTGALTEGGSALAIVTGLEMKLSQGMEPARPIFSLFPTAVVPGAVVVEGTLDLYLQNLALFNKFVNDTYSTLQFALTNGSTTHTWLLTKIKYGGAETFKAGGGSPVVQKMPFVGVYEGTTDLTSIKITRS